MALSMWLPLYCRGVLSAASPGAWRRLQLTCLIYVAPALLAGSLALLLPRSALLWALAAWAAAEVAFAAYHHRLTRRVSDALIANPTPANEDVVLLLDRILLLNHHVDVRHFISGWFMGAPVEHIKRDNLREFVAFSFFHRSFDQLSKDQLRGVDDIIGRVESAWGLRFEPGRNPDVQFMAHTREPLRALHHPLMLYVWAELVARFTHLVMLVLGFKRHSIAGDAIHYWHRPGPGGIGEPAAPARVFVHGLGIGITPYLSFIHMLAKDHSSATVVLELPHIALRLTPTIPSVDSMIECIERIHRRHSVGAACYIGHSYGSLVIARLLQQAPELVAAAGFVDPVCFLLCLPDVVHNFVYRQPEGRTMHRYAADWLRWYFCSKELQTCQVLCRGFDWHAVHLWPDQLPEHAVVMLAGDDAIVPSKQVRIHLEQHGVPTIFNDGFQHAQFLVSPSSQRAFLRALEGQESDVAALVTQES
eukprot:SM000003S10983  [mRNA]  locus=s3:146227:149981:+ [translate_table: standard]